MLEIERKYLVDMSKLTLPKEFKSIKQGYIPRSNDTTVRVRLSDDKAYITLKGPTIGISRLEYEYLIPFEDGLEMLKQFCGTTIDKRRYIVMDDGNRWEVDVFEGINKGLVIAEIELESEYKTYSLPEWVKEDVTHDKKYSNSNLIINPYTEW